MPNRSSQPAHASDCRIAERATRALQLRCEGYTYREIAQQVFNDHGEPMNHTHIRTIVIEALAELREHNAEIAKDVLQLELKRLDEQIKALWHKREDPRVSDTILRIAQRRADLLGLDAPKNIRLGGDGSGLPIKVEGSTVQLSMSERAARLREFGVRDVSALAQNGHGNGASHN